MTEAAVQSWHMLVRHARNLAREPIWIALLLIQPMLWLLLYSQLFQRITEHGGFGTDSYIDFFLPGVVVMNAFFAGTWAGMSMVIDLDRGVGERFLATPRGAARSSRRRSCARRSRQRSRRLILLVIGYALGARIAAGVILVAGMLIALLTRKEATISPSPTSSGCRSCSSRRS